MAILVIALMVGAFNGILVARFGIDSFIATMGVGTLLYGVSNWYSGGQQITGTDLPASFTGLTGIRIERHIIGSFTAAGFLSGLAGIMLGSLLQTGTPSVGPEYLLPAFAATLLGATSIRPGRVNVLAIKPHHIRVFDVGADGHLGGSRVVCEESPGIPDGFRIDADGNIWTSSGSGVQCITPGGDLLGRIPVPEKVANVAFGGAKRNRLFICGHTSLYSIFVNTSGAQRP